MTAHLVHGNPRRRVTCRHYEDCDHFGQWVVLGKPVESRPMRDATAAEMDLPVCRSCARRHP